MGYWRRVGPAQRRFHFVHNQKFKADQEPMPTVGAGRPGKVLAERMALFPGRLAPLRLGRGRDGAEQRLFVVAKPFRAVPPLPESAKTNALSQNQPSS